MALLPRLANLYFSGRLREIERFRRNPAQAQHRQLEWLLTQGARTKFGRGVGMERIRTAEEFRRSVPVGDYETLSGWIDRARRGEADVLWPGRVPWFAKSSGTTGSRSKYIPVTADALSRSHMRGPKDILALYCDTYPDSRVLGGKMLTLGGSKRMEREGDSALAGDLSAILIENTPTLAGLLRVPDKRTALIPDFDEKVRLIAERYCGSDVRSFTGVPSWNLVMLNRILEYTGKANILEVWPRMELFVHGGMDFRPYREQYRRIIPSAGMRYMETYNASEGFFAIARHPGDEDMLLMLDYGTYYEFLATEYLGDPSRAVPLEGVRTGVHYAVIISSCNGLWRYMIGDTVEFTSTDPYTIRFCGRTKHYMNAFGEEIILANAEAAMHAACEATGAAIVDYTAAPVYMEGRERGTHEWLVEFRREPSDMGRFTEALDEALRAVNSDYDAKRTNDYTLSAPRVTAARAGVFDEWLRGKGKVGGQNKVPRLQNDRMLIEEIKKLV